MSDRRFRARVEDGRVIVTLVDPRLPGGQWSGDLTAEAAEAVGRRFIEYATQIRATAGRDAALAKRNREEVARAMSTAGRRGAKARLRVVPRRDGDGR